MRILESMKVDRATEHDACRSSAWKSGALKGGASTRDNDLRLTCQGAPVSRSRSKRHAMNETINSEKSASCATPRRTPQRARLNPSRRGARHRPGRGAPCPTATAERERHATDEPQNPEHEGDGGTSRGRSGCGSALRTAFVPRAAPRSRRTRNARNAHRRRQRGRHGGSPTGLGTVAPGQNLNGN